MDFSRPQVLVSVAVERQQSASIPYQSIWFHPLLHPSQLYISFTNPTYWR